MNSIKRMIDNALPVCKTKTALAKTLGLLPQNLYDYERGRRHMPAHLVMRLATLANMNAVMELGRYEAEWMQKKLGGAAAGIAGAGFSLVVLSTAPGDATASVPCGTQFAHYAQRLRAWLRRLTASAQGARTPSAPAGLPYMPLELASVDWRDSLACNETLDDAESLKATQLYQANVRRQRHQQTDDGMLGNGCRAHRRSPGCPAAPITQERDQQPFEEPKLWTW